MKNQYERVKAPWKKKLSAALLIENKNSVEFIIKFCLHVKLHVPAGGGMGWRGRRVRRP